MPWMPRWLLLFLTSWVLTLPGRASARVVLEPPQGPFPGASASAWLGNGLPQAETLDQAPTEWPLLDGFEVGPNLYAYVRQNPWTSFDPDGLDTKPILSMPSFEFFMRLFRAHKTEGAALAKEAAEIEGIKQENPELAKRASTNIFERVASLQDARATHEQMMMQEADGLVPPGTSDRFIEDNLDFQQQANSLLGWDRSHSERQLKHDTKLIEAGLIAGGILFGGGGAASELQLIKPGSKEWQAAIKTLRQGGKNNFRVPNATDAKNLLKDARGNMNRYKQYTDKNYNKGYEMHMEKNAREVGVGNDLQHLKWKDGKSGGHVFFDKPN